MRMMARSCVCVQAAGLEKHLTQVGRLEQPLRACCFADCGVEMLSCGVGTPCAGSANTQTRNAALPCLPGISTEG